MRHTNQVKTKRDIHFSPKTSEGPPYIISNNFTSYLSSASWDVVGGDETALS